MSPHAEYFSCTKCGYATPTKEDVLQHYANNHDSQPPYVDTSKEKSYCWVLQYGKEYCGNSVTNDQNAVYQVIDYQSSYVQPYLYVPVYSTPSVEQPNFPSKGLPSHPTVSHNHSAQVTSHENATPNTAATINPESPLDLRKHKPANLQTKPNTNIHQTARTVTNKELVPAVSAAQSKYATSSSCDNSVYTCGHCSYQSFDQNKVEEHLLTVHDIRTPVMSVQMTPFICNFCDWKALCHRCVLLHRLQEHFELLLPELRTQASGNVPAYRCPYCVYFSDNTHMLTHLANHYAQMYKPCHRCLRAAAPASDLSHYRNTTKRPSEGATAIRSPPKKRSRSNKSQDAIKKQSPKKPLSRLCEVIEEVVKNSDTSSCVEVQQPNDQSESPELTTTVLPAETDPKTAMQKASKTTDNEEKELLSENGQTSYSMKSIFQDYQQNMAMICRKPDAEERKKSLTIEFNLMPKASGQTECIKRATEINKGKGDDVDMEPAVGKLHCSEKTLTNECLTENEHELSDLSMGESDAPNIIPSLPVSLPKEGLLVYTRRNTTVETFKLFNFKAGPKGREETINIGPTDPIEDVNELSTGDLPVISDVTSLAVSKGPPVSLQLEQVDSFSNQEKESMSLRETLDSGESSDTTKRERLILRIPKHFLNSSEKSGDIPEIKKDDHINHGADIAKKLKHKLSTLKLKPKLATETDHNNNTIHRATKDESCEVEVITKTELMETAEEEMGSYDEHPTVRIKDLPSFMKELKMRVKNTPEASSSEHMLCCSVSLTRMNEEVQSDFSTSKATRKTKLGDLTNQSMVICPYCPKSLTTERLHAHVLFHEAKSKYTCKKCNFSASFKWVIDEHFPTHKQIASTDIMKMTKKRWEKVKQITTPNLIDVENAWKLISGPKKKVKKQVARKTGASRKQESQRNLDSVPDLLTVDKSSAVSTEAFLDQLLANKKKATK